jgi:transcriptional regulator with XRE-family HTH domain
MGKKKSTGFGLCLRKFREAAGLSQAQLAERAGMHLHGVTKLEQGYREPSWATVLALAKALGVSTDAFAGSEASYAEGKPKAKPRGRAPKATPATPPAEDLETTAKKIRGRTRKKS